MTCVLLRAAIIGTTLTVAGCAAQPAMDGGIVGSGNRPECDTKAAKDGTPVPDECKSADAARRSP